MTSIYIGSMFSSSVVSCKLMKREMQFKLEIDMVEHMQGGGHSSLRGSLIQRSLWHPPSCSLLFSLPKS